MLEYGLFICECEIICLDISYLSDFEFEISVLFVSKIIPLDLDLYSTVDVGDIGDIKINLLQLAINGKYKD